MTPQERPLEALLERDVQSVCIDWLNSLPGLKMWRQNTGGRSETYTSKRTGIEKTRYVKFGETGQCDTIGILRPGGIMVQIEIKRDGKEPTLEQLAWMLMIRESGGISFWCDSLDSCVQQMRFEFKRRGWHWSKSWEV